MEQETPSWLISTSDGREFLATPNNSKIYKFAGRIANHIAMYDEATGQIIAGYAKEELLDTMVAQGFEVVGGDTTPISEAEMNLACTHFNEEVQQAIDYNLW